MDGKWKKKSSVTVAPIERRSVVPWLMWPLPPHTPYTGCFLCLPLTTTSIFHTADICAYVLATTKDTHLRACLAAQWCLVEVCVQKSLNDADKSFVWSITTRIQYEFMKPWGLRLSKRAFSSITHKTASRHHVMWIVTALGWYGKQMWALDINRIAWRGIEKKLNVSYCEIFIEKLLWVCCARLSKQKQACVHTGTSTKWESSLAFGSK